MANQFAYNGRLLVPYLSSNLQVEEVTELTSSGLLSPSHSSSCAAVGKYIYIIGGWRNNRNNNTGIVRFDRETEEMKHIPIAVPSNTSCAASGKYIYIFGGRSAGNDVISNQILRFDTETETMTTLPVVLPSVNFDSSCVAVGKYIYIIGGRNSAASSPQTCLNGILRFDTETEEAPKVVSSLTYAGYTSSCAAIGKYIYIIGGRSTYYWQVNSPQILCFDTETNETPKVIANLPSGLDEASCAVFGKYVYIFGGMLNIHTDTNKILRFDTESKTVTTLSAILPSARGGTSCATAGEYIYIFGGQMRGYENALSQILRFSSSAHYTFLSKITVGQKLTASETVYFDNGTDEPDIILAKDNFYTAEKDGNILGMIGKPVSGYIDDSA